MDARPFRTEPPILKLPIDVAYEIFTEACKDSSSAPLTLGSVCKMWRDVVWSSPQLWSTIVLKLSSKRSAVQVELLDLWLMNSQSCSLSIYFDVEDRKHSWCTADGPAVAALKKFVGHCERWEHLAICAFDDPAGEFRKVLEGVSGRVPLLQTLRLGRLGSATGRALWRINMFAVAPKLTAFAMSMESISLDSVSLPWSQLTSVHARRISTHDCIQILTLCSNLARCRFSDVSGREIAAAVISFGKLPRCNAMEYLTTLKVTNVDDDGILYMLHHLRCPTLSELSLDINMTYLETISDETAAYNIGDSRWSAVGDFLRRSNCPLVNLELTGSILTYSVSTLLKNLPTLKKLRLTDKGTIQANEDEPGSFVSFLTTLKFFDPGPNTHQKYLPQLKEFHYSGPDIVSAMLYLQMIFSTLKDRWNVPVAGVTRLEVFTAKLDMWYDSNNIPRSRTMKGFKDLMAEGMQISVKNLRGEEMLKKNFGPEQD